MRYIILAGGKGTRLQSVVSNAPKPMAPINGRPFLELLLEYLLPFDAEGFILCVSHMRQIIMDYFKGEFHGVPISYSIEAEPLGTGGAIAQAFRNAGLDNAVAINGDTLIYADYAKFMASCQNSPFGMLLAEVGDTSRYGRVNIKDGEIAGFVEKKKCSGAGLINAGSYWLCREVVGKMPQGAFSLENDFLEPRIKELAPKFYVSQDYFIDIGVPETYARACNELNRQ